MQEFILTVNDETVSQAMSEVFVSQKEHDPKKDIDKLFEIGLRRCAKDLGIFKELSCTQVSWTSC